MRNSVRPRTASYKRKEYSSALCKHKKATRRAPVKVTREISLLAFEPVSKSGFSLIQVVGRGGFGRVWEVEEKKTKKLFAMKEMLKLRVVSKRSVNSVMNERTLLEALSHPFIVNMHYAFTDRENLYLVMDLMTGGDLRYHIARQRRFTEEQTRFFVACLLLGLEYLHSQKVIHRDIKPENLVLDANGYLRLTDLGIARLHYTDNAKETSGTPGYMAPEVMVRLNHDYAVDYFALGVIVYEFMMGRRPYLGRDRKEVREQILSKQAQVRPEEAPPGWSSQALHFANSLIQRKAGNRLGANGPAEVKNHAWMKDFPWEELINNTLSAPFVPLKEDNFDPRFIGEWNDKIDQGLSNEAIQDMFNGYYYELPRQSALVNTKLQSQTPKKNSK